MEVILEIDDDGCGQLQFELPADATDEDVAYIESLVPRIETGLLELRDPRNRRGGIQLPAFAHWRVAAKDCDPQRGEADALKV